MILLRARGRRRSERARSKERGRAGVRCAVLAGAAYYTQVLAVVRSHRPRDQAAGTQPTASQEGGRRLTIEVVVRRQPGQ